MTQTLFENPTEFKPIWAKQPIGTIAWKVKTFNGNTGKCVRIEYTFDRDEDLEDMKDVANGYFTETYKMIKTQ